MLPRLCSAFLPDVIEGLGALLQPASRGVKVPRLDRLVQHISWETLYIIVHLMLYIITSDDVVDVWLYSWLTFLSWNNRSVLGVRGFLAEEEPWSTSPGVSCLHLLLQNYQNYRKVPETNIPLSAVIQSYEMLPFDPRSCARHIVSLHKASGSSGNISEALWHGGGWQQKNQ